MQRTHILSTGSFLPEKIISNEDLTQFSPEARKLIADKTGVQTRRHANESECTSDLAVAAARRCLQKIDFPPENLQGIVLSTSSPDRMQPATATRVQHVLGAGNAFAFDINSVCSGSSFGITVVDSLIQSGKFKTILLIASEMYSKILNSKDFSTYPFFGDGAGAVLFQAGAGCSGGSCTAASKPTAVKTTPSASPGEGPCSPSRKCPAPVRPASG